MLRAFWAGLKRSTGKWQQQKELLFSASSASGDRRMNLLSYTIPLLQGVSGTLLNCNTFSSKLKQVLGAIP